MKDVGLSARFVPIEALRGGCGFIEPIRGIGAPVLNRIMVRSGK
jgi:hypothetical protein